MTFGFSTSGAKYLQKKEMNENIVRWIMQAKILNFFRTKQK